MNMKDRPKKNRDKILMAWFEYIEKGPVKVPQTLIRMQKRAEAYNTVREAYELSNKVPRRSRDSQAVPA